MDESLIRLSQPTLEMVEYSFPLARSRYNQGDIYMTYISSYHGIYHKLVIIAYGRDT